MNRLPIFLQVRGRRIAVVGNGSLAARRVETLARAGAEVWLLTDQPSEEFDALKGQYRLGDLAAPEAFAGFPIIYFAYEPEEEPDEVQIARARKAGALVNVADYPRMSDFITPSVLDRNPLVVAISTGGDAPLLGRMLKARLETLIPSSYGRLAALAGAGRAALAEKLSSHQARLRFWERIYDGPIAEMVLAGDDVTARTMLEREIDSCRPDGSASDETPKGEVYLVGAGPGDPDLLTFRAFRLMQKADVVLYDQLVDPAIMDRVRRDAERIYVGKKRANHAVAQEEIGAMMVKLAKEGKRVLRLKGGDPFIFGRGGEGLAEIAFGLGEIAAIGDDALLQQVVDRGRKVAEIDRVALGRGEGDEHVASSMRGAFRRKSCKSEAAGAASDFGQSPLSQNRRAAFPLFASG